VRPIRLEDLQDHIAYERDRDTRVARIIALKRARRIAVGDKLMFVFENRDTVLFHIQEMVRAEKIVKPEKVQEEIDVYNELIPDDDALSATLSTSTSTWTSATRRSGRTSTPSSSRRTGSPRFST
jgi:hypothetical protein